MGRWASFSFECSSRADRRRLLGWFERDGSVTVPEEGHSATGTVETAAGRRPAEFAWTGRHCYVTTPGDARRVVAESVHLWDRAAVVECDRERGGVVDGRFLDATEGSVDGRSLSGLPGQAGNDLLYGLAMRHGFRFRPCAVETPDGAGPFLAALTDPLARADDPQLFVERLRARTGVDPTPEGLALLREDPARSVGPADVEADGTADDLWMPVPAGDDADEAVDGSPDPSLVGSVRSLLS